jgi:hypothetical protein
MKLKAREPNLPASSLRLSVPGKLMATLEDYARYYEAEHGQPIPLDHMVVEMLGGFVASDYDFARWRRGKPEASTKRTTTASRRPAGSNSGAER